MHTAVKGTLLYVIVPVILTLFWAASTTVDSSVGYLLPALVVPILGASFVGVQAIRLRHWALLAILAFTLVGLSVAFRAFVGDSDRALGNVSLDWQNGLKIITWGGLLGLALFNLQLLRTMRDPGYLAWSVFCFICLLSAFWSETPSVTAMSALSIIAYLLFAALLVQSVPQRAIWTTMMWALAAYAVLNLATVGLEQAYQSENGRFMGLSGHPNSLARQMAIFVIVVFSTYYRGYICRSLAIVLGLFGVSMMLATQSRTAAISLIIAFLCTRRSWPLLIMAGGLAFLLLSMNGSIDSLFAMFGREGSLSEAESMAGRDDLWQFVWGLIEQHPWLGSGFNSFESVATQLWTGLPDASKATHNNYLEVLYSTGLLGAVPFLLAMSILVYRWIVRPDAPRDLFVINAIVSSFTEVDVSSIAVLPTFAFFLVMAMDTGKRSDVH